MGVYGVLALQGDWQAHATVLRKLGAEVREVRLAEELEGLAGLVLPGGESTAILRLMEPQGLAEALRVRIAAVNIDDRKIDFVLAQPVAEQAPKRRSPRTTRPKS